MLNSSVFRAATLVLILAPLGCGRSVSTPADGNENDTAETQYDGLTASQVVGKMIDAYRDATSYMDNAEYAEHFSDAARRVPQQTHPHVTSVLFERPNRFRITRYVPSVEGPPQLATVVSDGQRLLADISDLGPQILDVEAPSKATFESIAPDPLLRTALFPVPIENLFPQLTFLLANETGSPWPTAAAERLEMLPPAPLERKGHPTVECFRVRIASPLGAYVYWIDRKAYLLHRLELPSDEVRRVHYADRNLGSYQLIIDFYDATIDVKVPDDAFQLEVPEGARRVERFTAPAPVGSTPAGPQLEGPTGKIPESHDAAEAESESEEG